MASFKRLKRLWPLVTLSACAVTQAEEAPLASPPPLDLPFNGSGNEPPWQLRVTEDRTDFSVGYSGGEGAATPTPEPTATERGWRFDAATEAHALTVEAERAVCRDSMSGVPHPLSVTVAFEGRTYHGCGGEPASLLRGAEWVAEDLNGRGVLDRVRATLNFDGDGRVSGNAGCNRYTGPYELTGEGLTIGPLAATRMACPEAVMRQEAAFLAALEATFRFDVADDGALLLEDKQDETVVSLRER